MLKNFLELCQRIQRVNAPFWKSEFKGKAYLLLGLAILSTFGFVYAQYLITVFNQQFYDVLQNVDHERFITCIKDFTLISSMLVGATGLQFYFAERLGLKWREYLTKYCLDLYTRNGNYYFWNHVENPGDNPDQRISEDAHAFVSGVVTLGKEMLKQVVTFSAFIVVLWAMSNHFKVFGSTIPGSLVFASLLLAAVGTGFSHLLGNRIVPLNFTQQAHEADLRFQLVRLRENSESIFLMKGSLAEKARLVGKLGQVIKNYGAIIHKQTGLSMFVSIYTTTANAAPTLLLAPAFFAKEMTLGQIVQGSMSFVLVNTAMAFFVNFYGSAAQWIACVKRLDDFLKAMDAAETLRVSTETRSAPSDRLSFHGIRMGFPKVLEGTRPLNHVLERGQRLMVVGSSGAGKTTLIRLAARLWPFYEGSFEAPPRDDITVLPQKPYLPIGTIREVLSYPEAEGTWTDLEIANEMKFVGLEKLSASLNEVANWSLILSPGEQQRLGWARAFLQQPKFLFLDEATSALDVGMQTKLYTALEKRLPETTILSVAHRAELSEFHDEILDLDRAAAHRVAS